jgi:uncharacterized CHY-type Zn-finger protein
MIAMQTRCVHCGREQYALAVWDISHGQHPCCFCGEMSEEMSVEEYNKKIREMRKNENKKTT